MSRNATDGIGLLRWLTRLRAISLVTLIVALLAAGSVRYQRFAREAPRYRKLAQLCEKKQKIYNDYARKYDSKWAELSADRHAGSSLRLMAGETLEAEQEFARDGAARSREIAAYFQGLKRIYDRAARMPWARVPDSLQHPRWEDELEPYDDGSF